MGRRWLRPGAIWAPSRVWDSPRREGSSIAWRSTRGGPGAGTAASPRTPRGGWGGAHPFAVLDYSVVHNGEISSYGINRRYLEMLGYRCTLRTDTAVVTYLFDLMLRRHGLPVEMACRALASPFWGGHRQDAGGGEGALHGSAHGLRERTPQWALRHSAGNG